MGWPVVTVAAGGLPIVEATFGTPVTEAAHGYGTPVTKVVGKPGLPVVFETIGAGIAPAGPPLDAYTTGLTAAWSMSRKLVTAYGGSFYLNTSGNVETLYDQAGSSRDMSAGVGVRPAVATQGGLAVADFTPNTHALSSAAGMSQFITASAGYIVLVVYMDAHVSTQSVVFRDGQIATQISVLTSTSQMSAYNDGGGVTAGGAATAVSLPSANVFTWRHEGGVLYASVNGGTEVSASSGNTSNLTGAFIFARTGSFGFDGKLYEAYIWNTVPSSGDRTAIVAQAKTYVGIP
jgi:hypothetical protein